MERWRSRACLAYVGGDERCLQRFRMTRERPPADHAGTAGPCRLPHRDNSLWEANSRASDMNPPLPPIAWPLAETSLRLGTRPSTLEDACPTFAVSARLPWVRPPTTRTTPHEPASAGHLPPQVQKAGITRKPLLQPTRCGSICPITRSRRDRKLLAGGQRSAATGHTSPHFPTAPRSGRGVARHTLRGGQGQMDSFHRGLRPPGAALPPDYPLPVLLVLVSKQSHPSQVQKAGITRNPGFAILPPKQTGRPWPQAGPNPLPPGQKGSGGRPTSASG